MSDTPSVSSVFTRSCALNSLLTPVAVQQIRTDLLLVNENCHEASLLPQSFLLNFPLASRALVEQDSHRCNFTYRKGLSPYLTCPARQLASNVETSLPKISQSWTKYYIRAHRRGLDKTNLFTNYLLSLIPDEPWAPLEASVRTENEQSEEVIVDSVLEHYINFNLNNSRNRFFLLNAYKFILSLLQRFPATASLLSSHDKITVSSKEIGKLFSLILKFHNTYSFFSHMHCWKKVTILSLASHQGSKFIEVPSHAFHSVKKFPLIEGSSSKTKFIKNTCPYLKFNINRKSLKNRFKNFLLKTIGNELLLTFEGKNNDSENTDELDESPKKKRRLKKEIKSCPDANKTRETQLKGTKKCPVEDVDIQSKFYLKGPLLALIWANQDYVVTS
ncbi:hypothetical protein P9112_002595 [Eukaryota sp. TZLM1-RC]